MFMYTVQPRDLIMFMYSVQPGDLIMFMYLYNQGIWLCLCTCTTRGSDYVYVHCTTRGSNYVYVLAQPGDLILVMYLYNQGCALSSQAAMACTTASGIPICCIPISQGWKSISGTINRSLFILSSRNFFFKRLLLLILP